MTKDLFYYIIYRKEVISLKEKTCCFTGHRMVPNNEKDILTEKTAGIIEQLINKGYERFVTGGAIGFDMLSAISVLAMKKKYPHIKLILCIPCKGQELKWNSVQQMYYNYIMENSDEVEILNEKYVTGCMHQRNRRMVELSSVCVAYLTRNFGGTKATLDYAKDSGLQIIYVNCQEN